MTFPWKNAGITYNRYLAIASRAIRRSLREEKRLEADKREPSTVKFAKWENGKQGEQKELFAANAEAMANSASGSSS